eukprot:GILK01003516.1.p1 GENE.GILK01003516.1~~GILK01003516.1.p1  ORF type:complete len:177 (-),score=30.24 GILK01003516.1:81-572(-)
MEDAFQPTVSHRLCFLTTGFFVSALPIYLFVSIFEMSLSEYALLYVPITIVSTLFMSFSYQNLAGWNKARLMRERDLHFASPLLEDDKKTGKKSAGQEKRQAIRQAVLSECMSFTLLVNNSVFFGLFLVLSFVFLKSIPSPINFALSVLGASSLQTYVSKSMH